jgi:hypothetical protein
MDVPWIPYCAREFLDGLLTPEMRAFEWGSGGSTFYLVERVASVISIEHEWQPWLNVNEKLPQDEQRVLSLYIAPSQGQLGDSKAQPDHYFSACFPGQNFRQYASVIDWFEPFNFVLVDGRARPSCLMHAKPKVEPGGWLLLDNSDRAYYLEQVSFEGWREEKFYGPGPYNDYSWEATFYGAP